MNLLAIVYKVTNDSFFIYSSLKHYASDIIYIKPTEIDYFILHYYSQKRVYLQNGVRFPETVFWNEIYDKFWSRKMYKLKNVASPFFLP